MALRHIKRRWWRLGGQKTIALLAPATDVTVERTDADLREVVVEPRCQSRIQIDDVACGIDREKPGWGMVEVVDGVLQLLKHIFLALAVACDIGNRPHGHARVTTPLSERPHTHPQPSGAFSGGPGNPYLFVQTPPLARSFKKPVNRFRNVRVTDEHAFDRSDVTHIGRADQIEIGRVGIDDAAALVGHEEAIEGAVHHRLEQGIALVLAREFHDARC